MRMSNDLGLHGFNIAYVIIVGVVVSFLRIVDGSHQHRVMIDS